MTIFYVNTARRIIYEYLYVYPSSVRKVLPPKGDTLNVLLLMSRWPQKERKIKKMRGREKKRSREREGEREIINYWLK